MGETNVKPREYLLNFIEKADIPFGPSEVRLHDAVADLLHDAGTHPLYAATPKVFIQYCQRQAELVVAFRRRMAKTELGKDPDIQPILRAFENEMVNQIDELADLSMPAQNFVKGHGTIEDYRTNLLAWAKNQTRGFEPPAHGLWTKLFKAKEFVHGSFNPSKRAVYAKYDLLEQELAKFLEEEKARKPWLYEEMKQEPDSWCAEFLRNFQTMQAGAKTLQKK